MNDFSQKDSWFHKYKESQFKYKYKKYEDGAETGEHDKGKFKMQDMTS